jgi:hypothetical protein
VRRARARRRHQSSPATQLRRQPSRSTRTDGRGRAHCASASAPCPTSTAWPSSSCKVQASSEDICDERASTQCATTKTRTGEKQTNKQTTNKQTNKQTNNKSRQPPHINTHNARCDLALALTLAHNCLHSRHGRRAVRTATERPHRVVELRCDEPTEKAPMSGCAEGKKKKEALPRT